ncbi:MAG: response regulator [Deltaproteobacteria bacterium]|uniref:response regulator n=1 Tax=Desulfobacula sp. TaxID=2593537 RepID=UPI0019C2D778|nr:response regulator [Candidatus Desulfobacula maris]MBL6993103.1 response regulator [Desulfobacula sp.]
MKNTPKILIVDDKPANLFSLGQILKETGAQIIQASNGNEALAASLNHDFALALLDVQMPEMDGYELAEWLRSEQKTKELPIIFVSAVYSSDYHVFKGYDAGAVDFMVKPFNPKILLSKINVFLQLDLQKTLLKQYSEARFQRLIESMTDAVIIVDKEGIVQFINPAGETLFRTTSSNFLGNPFGFPMAEDEGMEISLFSRDENPVTAEMRVVETDWKGSPAWLASIRDITDRKKMENKLVNAFDELKNANQKILEQQASVIEEERLNVLLQLSGATAHELNQPLTVILGNIEILETFYDLQKNEQKTLSDIKTAAKNIADIVKKIRNIRYDQIKPNAADSYIIDFNQKIRILFIEDEKEEYLLLKEMLSANQFVELFHAKNIETAFLRLETESFDIILLDYLLPDGTGFDFMKKFKAAGYDTPIAVVTGQTDEVIASEIIRAGALDYLPKSLLTASSAIRMIEGILQKSSLRSELKLANTKLIEMATIDALTHLYNRRFFNDAIEAEFERSRRYKQEMLLLFADPDHFKKIADTHGPIASDMVLKTLSRFLLEQKRKNDIACRFENKRFSIIFPHTSKQNGFHAAEKYRKKIEKNLFSHNEVRFSLTLSMGVASTQDASSCEALLKNADKALYQAKQEGGNRTILF